jgi:hypothetical protein
MRSIIEWMASESTLMENIIRPATSFIATRHELLAIDNFAAFTFFKGISISVNDDPT